MLPASLQSGPRLSRPCPGLCTAGAAAGRGAEPWRRVPGVHTRPARQTQQGRLRCRGAPRQPGPDPSAPAQSAADGAVHWRGRFEEPALPRASLFSRGTKARGGPQQRRLHKKLRPRLGARFHLQPLCPDGAPSQPASQPWPHGSAQRSAGSGAPPQLQAGRAQEKRGGSRAAEDPQAADGEAQTSPHQREPEPAENPHPAAHRQRQLALLQAGEGGYSGDDRAVPQGDPCPLPLSPRSCRELPRRIPSLPVLPPQPAGHVPPPGPRLLQPPARAPAKG